MNIYHLIFEVFPTEITPQTEGLHSSKAYCWIKNPGRRSCLALPLGYVGLPLWGVGNENAEGQGMKQGVIGAQKVNDCGENLEPQRGGLT